jgi:hypothetical protein
MMRKTILAALAALAMGATTAPAATYTVDVTADAFRGSPGLNTRAWKLTNGGPQAFTGTTLNFDLTNIGDSFTADIYRLVTFEPTLDADDTTASPSTASFDFGFGSVTVLGTTQGVLGPVPSALATFVDGAINIGGGLQILISLADVTFATDGTNYVRGRDGAGVVTATFTLAAIPLPAAGSLALLGLGALAFAGRRRQTV